MCYAVKLLHQALDIDTWVDLVIEKALSSSRIYHFIPQLPEPQTLLTAVLPNVQLRNTGRRV